MDALAQTRLDLRLGAFFHPIFTRVPCDAHKLLILWRSLRDSNPCYSLESANSLEPCVGPYELVCVNSAPTST